MPNLPEDILLYHSESAHQDKLRQLLAKMGINIRESSYYAELNVDPFAHSTSLALAILENKDQHAINFLRSCLHAHNYVQRILLVSSVDFDSFYLAVNKAHINYMVKLPVQEEELSTILRKAHKRYLELTRPFKKLDALTEVTENLLIDNEKYRQEANTDALTGLLNRRAFEEILDRFRENFNKHQFNFSLALIDIDHFKKINDTFSHQAGDLVLRELSAILLKNQRVGMDYAFRYGGEEFAILAAGTRQQEMLRYLQRLLKLVHSHNFSFQRKNIPTVTFSAGIVECLAGDTKETLVKKADAALYFAKNSGRNRCVVFEPDMLK